MAVLPNPNIDSDLGLACGLEPFSIEHFFSQGSVKVLVLYILPLRTRIACSGLIPKAKSKCEN